MKKGFCIPYHNDVMTMTMMMMMIKKKTMTMMMMASNLPNNQPTLERKVKRI